MAISDLDEGSPVTRSIRLFAWMGVAIWMLTFVTVYVCLQAALP